MGARREGRARTAAPGAGEAGRTAGRTRGPGGLRVLRGGFEVNAEETEQINRLFLTPVKTSLYMKENENRISHMVQLWVAFTWSY